MRPRFQADADFNRKILSGIRRREPSIDFQSARDGNIIGLTDPEVLLAAAEDHRILVSHDRRTMPGYFAKFIGMRSSSGVIILSQSLAVGSAIEELLLIWAATGAEEWTNVISSIPD